MQALIDKMQDFAKDIKLNLSSVLTESGAPGLNERQIFGVALASAFATQNQEVIANALEAGSQVLNDADREAAKKAATIMAMNNVYYRFLHYVDDEAITKLPARLRMNALASPGVEKVDFELYSLAVSAMNGCGKCMKSHANELKKAGVSAEGIQSAIRIASVIQATKQALAIS